MHQHPTGKIFARCLAGTLFFILGLNGCGPVDDGGAGSSSTGSTAPAVISAANANQLVGAVFGTSFFARGFSDVVLELVGEVPETSISKVITGTFGGTLTISGSIDGTTLAGNLTMVFANYSNIDGEMMSGTVFASIIVFDADNLIPLDMLMNFSNFAYTGSTGSFTMQGNIHALTILAANSVTLTVNLTSRDNTTSEIGRVDNLVVFSIYDDVLSPTPTLTSVIITGRVFEPTEGYVDVNTVSPLTFSPLAILFPDDGGPVILAGASGSSVRVIPTTAAEVFIEADVDGDTVYETQIGPEQWNSL